MFNAFSNDDDVLNIQGDALTVSNGTTRVTLRNSSQVARKPVLEGAYANAPRGREGVHTSPERKRWAVWLSSRNTAHRSRSGLVFLELEDVSVYM